MYERTAAPDVPADAFAQAKGQVRERSATFDGEILQATADAIDWVERTLNVQLITTTFTATFDCFPSDSGEIVVLAPAPLSSITSIKYNDDDGVQQTWSSVTGYDVYTAAQPGFFRPKYNQEYPAARDGVIVAYSCGYGTGWDNVPPLIRKAVLLRVEELYRQTEVPNLSDILYACRTGDEFHEYP